MNSGPKMDLSILQSLLEALLKRAPLFHTRRPELRVSRRSRVRGDNAFLGRGRGESEDPSKGDPVSPEPPTCLSALGLLRVFLVGLCGLGASVEGAALSKSRTGPGFYQYYAWLGDISQGQNSL